MANEQGWKLVAMCVNLAPPTFPTRLIGIFFESIRHIPKTLYILNLYLLIKIIYNYKIVDCYLKIDSSYYYLLYNID